jgi:hypothetical protein
MKNVFILILVLVTVNAEADDGVDITDQRQVAALISLQEKIDVVSSAVTECVKSGGVHNECLCASRESIDAFKRAVESLFLAHPDLQSFDLVRFRDPDGNSVAQSLSGIKAQAALELSCS